MCSRIYEVGALKSIGPKTSQNIVAFINFAKECNLTTPQLMKTFLDKVGRYHVYLAQQSRQQMPQEPQEQSIQQIQQEQPMQQEPQNTLNYENLNSDNSILFNTKMSGFDEYASAYGSNIGRAKKSSKQAMYDEAARAVESMSTDDVKQLAKRYLVSGARTIAGDPTAQYGGYEVFDMGADEANRILEKPKNAWAKFIKETPRDIKFKPNLLHDDYSAWYAAKNGLKAYKGDFNVDGTPDYMITDERGNIKYYNGYGLVPSKQAQYVEYNKIHGFDKNEKGFPFRPSDVESFREWNAAHARNLQKQGQLAGVNKALGGGMVKYKPRYKTVAELVKDKLTAVSEKGQSILEQLLVEASNSNANKAKAITKTCNITKLVGIVLKPVLAKIAGQQLDGNVQTLTSYIQKEVQPVLNVQNEAWAQLKDQIANFVVTLLQSQIPVQNETMILGVYILGAKYNGAPDENIITPIYNSVKVPPELAQAFQDAKKAKESMKSAWKAAHPTTSRFGKVAQRAKDKRTFDINSMDEENVVEL